MRRLDSEAAAAACGKSAWTVRKAVRDGRVTNHGTARDYELDLDEVLLVLGDPHRILG